LFEPFLIWPLRNCAAAILNRPTPLVRIAGVCGRINQAAAEAEFAQAAGYQAASSLLGALREATETKVWRTAANSPASLL